MYGLEEALQKAGPDPQPFIIGGGEIFKMALPFADKIELTLVHGTFEADAFFPHLSGSNWHLVSEIHHPKDEFHNYSFTYQTFIKKSAP